MLLSQSPVLLSEVVPTFCHHSKIFTCHHSNFPIWFSLDSIHRYGGGPDFCQPPSTSTYEYDTVQYGTYKTVLEYDTIKKKNSADRNPSVPRVTSFFFSFSLPTTGVWMVIRTARNYRRGVKAF